MTINKTYYDNKAEFSPKFILLFHGITLFGLVFCSFSFSSLSARLLPSYFFRSVLVNIEKALKMKRESSIHGKRQSSLTYVAFNAKGEKQQ
jgi:hypothetical protein